MRTAIERFRTPIIIGIVALFGALGCFVGSPLTGPGGDSFHGSVPDVAVITLSPSAISGPAGRAVQIQATAKTQSGDAVPSQDVDWESSNTAAATVSGTGNVTLLHKGTTTITAIATGVTASIAVNVGSPAPTSISVAPSSTEIEAGQTVQLGATAYDGSAVDSGFTMTWTSSNSGVASVSPTGLVKAVAAGNATITAASTGASGTAAIQVKSTAPVVASVSVSPATATLNPGRTAQLAATLKDASGNTLSGIPVTWSTSNSTAASVSSSGLVTGNAIGSATITASAGGHSGTAVMTVAAPVVASVSVTPGSATLAPAQTVQLTATPRDAGGNVLSASVSWTTSAAGVASVSSSGLVTGNTVGSATITATAGGIGGNASITVDSGPPSGFHEPPGMATQINTGSITSTSVMSIFSPTSPNAQAEWSGNLTVVPGGTGLRVNYPTDLPGGYSPVRFGHNIASAGNGWYYQRMKVRFSSNWTLNGNVGVKFCEPRTQQQGNGQGPNENHVIGAHDFDTYSTNAFFYVLLQGPNGHFQDLFEQPQYSPAANLKGGAWHLVEVLFTPESTPGAGDGTYTGWIDGTQIASWSSVLWLAPGNQVGWPYLMFDPTYGGGTHSPPQDMYWDFDQLYVSTR